MEWYKTLDINRKIALKEMCIIICGIRFEDLVFLMPFKQIIQMIYNKLKIEGFDI